jgi:hypothetical protein
MSEPSFTASANEHPTQTSLGDDVAGICTVVRFVVPLKDRQQMYEMCSDGSPTVSYRGMNVAETAADLQTERAAFLTIS